MLLIFVIAKVVWCIEPSYPFDCSDLLCNEDQILNFVCDPLCMTPSCNYDSGDFFSDDWISRFQFSGCLSTCESLNCNLSTLGISCDPSCNILECGFGLGACGYCAQGCTQELLLNDICDPQCNTRVCMYDNDACGWCAPGCFKSNLTFTTCISDCSVPECNYQNSICDSDFCSPGCSPIMLTNSICDESCNVMSCDYDNWTCVCSLNCTSYMEYNEEQCFPECNTPRCGFQRGKCGGCNSGCFEGMLGDLTCNPECNVESCKYDLGDCSCSPGCNSAYDPGSDSWIWDIEDGGCKIECLVEDCLFNFGVCKDHTLIRAAWFQQLIKDDISSNLNLTNCTSKHPMCTEEELRKTDENGECSKACESTDCFSCMGLAEMNLGCLRTFGSFCLICQGTKQVYNYCFTSDVCPEGFRLEPGLKDTFFGAELCFRHPQKYTLKDYYVVYMSPDGNDENNGSSGKPLRTLSKALQKATRKFSAIYISSGDYYYSKEEISNPLVLNPLSPLNFALNLYINKIALMGISFTTNPVIYLTEDHMIFQAKAAEFAIISVDFNGTYALSRDCIKDICKYCPNLLKSNGRILDDRDNIIKNSEDYAQNCVDFHDLNFITISANSLLRLESLTVSNFQQQFSTFVYSEGSVHIYNVYFSRVQSYAFNNFITVICTENCNKQDFKFSFGSVMQLNYGYEYSDYLVQPGFLNVEGVGKFLMENVQFKYVMAITGKQETRINYLINIKNLLGNIMIRYCDFNDAFVNGIISVDSTTLSYTDYTLNANLYIEQYILWNFQLHRNNFNNITSMHCVICYSMDTITQNLEVEYNTFTNIAANDKGLFIIYDPSQFNSFSEVGGWTYVKVNNIITVGWWDPSFITFKSNTLKNIQFAGAILSYVNQPNIMLQQMLFENITQITVNDINKYGPINFSQSPYNYLSKSLYSTQIVISNCAVVLEITKSSRIILLDTTINFTSCPSGSSGISLKESKELTSTILTAVSITDQSFLDFILFENINKIQLFSMTLIGISMQSTSVFRVFDCNEFLMVGFMGQNMSSLYKPCLELEKIKTLEITNSSCNRCSTNYGDGGSLYILPNTSNSSVLLQNYQCDMCQATVGFGGGIYIESYSRNLFHNISLLNIKFNRCSAVEGAGIYLSNRLSLNKAILRDLVIANSFGTLGGALADFHNAGVIFVSNFTSVNNSGYFSGIKGSYLGIGPRIIIESVLVSNSQASESIFYFSSANIGASVNLSSVRILSNINTTSIYVKNIQLSLSIITIDSGLGAYLENSILFGSYISFVDLDKYALRSTSSYLSCNFCSFNRIKSGPVLVIENQSSFNITNSTFTKIYSESPGIVLYMSLCPNTNLFENCTFSFSTSPSAALMEVQSSQIIIRNCAINETNSQGITPGISISASKIYIYDTNFTNHQGNIGVFLYLSTKSLVEVYNSKFINGNAIQSGGVVYSIYSTFKAVNCVFKYNKADSGLGIGGALHSTTSSNLIIHSCVFIENSAISSGSSIDFSGISLSISDSSFYTSASQSPVISLTSIDTFIFDSSNITGINTQGISSTYTKNFLIKNSIFANLKGAINAISSSNTKSNAYQIVNSWFYNNSVIEQGGALELQGVSMLIHNTVFMNNSADSGGAIAYSCPGSYCAFDVSFCRFKQNHAATEGGAIEWLDRKPNYSNTTFTKNSAKYGDDLASFPAILEFSSSSRTLLQDLIECAPGQLCKRKIILTIKDSASNIMTLDNSSTAIMSTTNKSYSISGNTKETAINGVFTFTDFIISGEPGTKVNITISTVSIDPSIASLVGDNVEYSDSVHFLVKLRDCVIGEQVSTTACMPCGPGTYVIDPAASCKTCPLGGNCTGGWKIYPLPGYWKPTNLSDVLYSCPNKDSCLGSLNESDFLGSCSGGYKGNQCFGCESGYSRTTSNQCAACPEPVVNAVILIFLMIFLILQGAILVISTIRSAYSEKSLYSIYIKIFTNYMQLVFLTTQLDLKWPWFVIELFSAQKSVVSSSNQIFSFDCYLASNDRGYDIVFSKKLLLMALLPLMIWLFSLIIWVIVCIKKDTWKYLKKEYLTSVIALFFLVYPNIVQLIFSVFSCVYISELGFWMADNLQIKCWDDEHFRREMSIAIPAIIVWAIGTPTIILVALHKKRKSFKTDSTKVIFGFLFTGYKNSRYYWEFLIMYRKIIIICISVFLTQISRMVQGLTLIFVLVISLYLQDHYKPFNHQQLNHMEVEGILTATVTIYCGLYYYSEGIGPEMSVVLFLIIIAGNLYFIWYWLYYMLAAVFEAFSSSFYILRKLRGKMDSYPEYIFHNQLIVPGVIKDENEGTITYSLFDKQKKKPELINTQEFNCFNDLKMTTFFKYAEKIKNNDKNCEINNEDYFEKNIGEIVSELEDEVIPNERDKSGILETEVKLRLIL